MRYRVFNNVLSSSDYIPLATYISEGGMSFAFSPRIVDYPSEPCHDYSFQFVRLIHDGIMVHCHDSFKLVLPILNFLNATAIRRIKCNLTPRTPSNLYDYLHTDGADTSNYYSAIYYVNDNNGGTKFEDGTFIPSVSNRLLVFDGHLKHTHMTCTDAFVRMVINFVIYLPNDNIFTSPNYPSLKGD